MGSGVSLQADVLLPSYRTNWLRLNTVTDSVAVNWITILFSNMSAVLCSSRVSLSLTGMQHAVIHPFIKLLWKQWAVWSQPLPSLPVQRDMGAKDRCRLISANLISGVCLSQLHGLHINWDHANKTGLNFLNYRCFFLPLQYFFIPFPVSQSSRMDASSLLSINNYPLWRAFRLCSEH